jgi:hypothetical protein
MGWRNRRKSKEVLGVMACFWRYILPPVRLVLTILKKIWWYCCNTTIQPLHSFLCYSLCLIIRSFIRSFSLCFHQKNIHPGPVKGGLLKLAVVVFVVVVAVVIVVLFFSLLLIRYSCCFWLFCIPSLIHRDNAVSMPTCRHLSVTGNIYPLSGTKHIYFHDYKDDYEKRIHYL